MVRVEIEQSEVGIERGVVLMSRRWFFEFDSAFGFNSCFLLWMHGVDVPRVLGVVCWGICVVCLLVHQFALRHCLFFFATMVFEPFTLAWCKAQPPVPGRTWIFVDGNPREMLPTGHTRPPALRPAPARRLVMYIIPRPQPVVAARGVPVKRRDVDPEFEVQRLLKWFR